MKKILLLTLIMALGVMTGCQNQNEIPAIEPLEEEAVKTVSETVKLKPDFIEGEDYDELGGADSYNFLGDNATSRFYVNPDFYRLKSDETLTLIEGFKTMQQTTEWSCGNAVSLMTLWNMGKTDLTEWDIALAMGSSVDDDTEGALPGSANNFHEYGTTVEDMYNFFSNLEGFKVLETSYRADYTEADLVSEEDGATPSNIGNLKPTFSSSSLYASENSDDTEAWVDDAKDSYFVTWLTGHLKAGRPVMVEWGDWDGHWISIIGYDNNGTPSIGDDTLIFADPYDTSDHWQDGYAIFPLERFFYMWQDRKVAPKPYQLQPFIVVDKVTE